MQSIFIRPSFIIGTIVWGLFKAYNMYYYGQLKIVPNNEQAVVESLVYGAWNGLTTGFFIGWWLDQIYFYFDRNFFK